VRSLCCRSTISATGQINVSVHMSSKSIRMFVQHKDLKGAMHHVATGKDTFTKTARNVTKYVGH